MIRIGTNISSLLAQRQLAKTSSELETVFERLSSGLRINKASDDAAGLAIVSSLNADSRVYTQAIRNVNDGLSLLNIANGALGEISNISVRQRELATQAANGSYSFSQRKVMNKEINSLVEEFNRIVESVGFNGLNLLDGSLSQLTIQAGYGINGSISFGLGDELSRTVGDGTFSFLSTRASTAGYDLVSGDVTGDGIVDLVGVSTGPSGVTLNRGNGDGTFNGPQNFAGDGSTQRSIALADLDNDGDLDAIAGSLVFLNDGDSSPFSGGYTDLATGLISGYAVAGDVNGDGKLDIVASDYSSASVSIVLGNGDGTFRSPSALNGNSNSRGATLADFNGDNRLDIFVAGNTTTSGLFIGNGDGTFGAINSITVSNGGGRAVAGDFNADGFMDMAVNGSGVNILFGNGNGSFQSSVVYTGGGIVPRGITAADLNGDGITDLVATAAVTGNASVLLGNRDGTFSSAGNYSVATAYAAAIGDFNGDGALDLGIKNQFGGSVDVYLANPIGVTTCPYLDIYTQQNARGAMEIIDATMARISSEIGSIGGIQSRLTVALNVLAESRENFDAAASRISDADVASETSELVRARILQQAASAVLAQANQQPALALKLLSIK